MSLRSFKVVVGELISNFVDKYNRLVDKIIYNVDIDDQTNTMRFYTADRVIEVPLPDTGGGDGGGGGTPEDNEYDSNNFITDGDPYNKVISDLDAILGALAPATAESLSGKDVPYNNELIFYRARLSSGMESTWYSGSYQPGALLDRYTVDNTYTIYTPTNTFRAGTKNNPTGKLIHVVDGSQYVSLSVSSNETTGTFSSAIGNSSMRVSSSVHNSIWQRGSGTVDFTQTRPGLVRHAFRNTDDENTTLSQTNDFAVWYDNANAAPSFQGAVSALAISPQLKYLSGIAYYGRNSTLSVSYVGVNLFRNCYHPDNVSIITSGYFANVVVQPINAPSSTANYNVSQPVTLSNADVSSGSSNGVLSVALYRPNGATISQNATLDRRVCTYGTVATDTDERFFDESRRVLNETLTPFNSQASLVNGHAQVLNGALVYGSDYARKTGEQEYQRLFVKPSASNGVLGFQGVTHTQISAYGSGDLNVLIKLDGSNLYFDMGIPNGAGGDGSSRATAKGCKRDDASAGGNAAFTFGLSSTADANNFGKYRVIIIFRDTTNAKNMAISRLTTT